jgi:ACS family hexuronate transporter-like MFS transporter
MSPTSVLTSIPVGRFRWRICALLFFATTINYIDRNVLSFIMLDVRFKAEMLGLEVNGPLSPGQEADFKALMGYVDAAFKGAYALGFLLMGWFIDRVGTRIGYAVSIGVWVLSAISHAFVSGFAGLRTARMMLGIGESGNFPSAIKTVAEWFPQKERSLAVGIFNAGANIGIIATAFSVPLLFNAFGWRTTFLITSSLGFILLILWLVVYRKPEQHPSLSAGELAYITEGRALTITRIPWLRLFPYRQTWAFATAKFCTDCIWWFYVFWLPSFFADNAFFRLDLKTIGIPFLVIYIVSDGGSVLFGWVSSKLISRGWPVNRARKTTMLLCALCVVPIFFASYTSSLWIAVGLISLAAAAHQGWSANLFTTVSDMFPGHAVGSVVGIGGMFGAIGGMLFSAGSGLIIGAEKNYLPLFLLASVAYLLALLLMHLWVPDIDRYKVKEV